jgi:hypothetical protein
LSSLPLPPLPLLSLSPLSLSPLLSLLFVVAHSSICMLGGLSIWLCHFPPAVLHILLSVGRQQLVQRWRGPIIDAVTLHIVVRHNRQPHAHCLDTVMDVPYVVWCTLVNFDINTCIVGRASPGVAQWDAMGVNWCQWAAMCGNRATLILPKTEQEGSWLKSHKHHKSTECMVSVGDPKRDLVPPGRHQ